MEIRGLPVAEWVKVGRLKPGDDSDFSGEWSELMDVCLAASEYAGKLAKEGGKYIERDLMTLIIPFESSNTGPLQIKIITHSLLHIL